MKSGAVLQAVFRDANIKAVAAELGLNVKTLYKWCEPDGGRASGALNPLERCAEVWRLTEDRRVVEWICREANGYFVPNPPVTPPGAQEGLQLCSRVLEELGLLEAALARRLVSHAWPAAEQESVRSLCDRFKADLERVLARGWP